MMAIPAAIAPRIGSLLRLLASPIDGEALGAARAIGRTLKGAGVDWHALADAVERPVMVTVDRPEPSPQARRSRKARTGNVDLGFAQRRDVTEALRRALSGSRLSEWETEFAISILGRLQGARGRLTERQGHTLGRLLVKFGEGSAWR